MKQTTEQKAADTVLQKPFEVTIGEKTYQVDPPTMGTIIEASALISTLPGVKMDQNNLAFEVLAIADKCTVVGDIIALLVIGHKNRYEQRKIKTGKFWPWQKKSITVKVDRIKELAEEIIDTFPPKQANLMLTDILTRMDAWHFFDLTTSLCEINLLRKTKAGEVVKTTQSGV